ncbi:zinc ribbon domain-containing protein [Halorubrum salinum]|uniref:zinc ribbon domain-containing protein n=1 Tax=Halorubrum salinum TaxID=767517 RepID=UPI002111612A|nr:zinc ribbon domain-containing protein [Halorubrum salinum]
MVEVGTVYLAVIGVLLLAVLALGLRVLGDIFNEARERHRRRKSGDLESHTEDETSVPGPSTSPDEAADTERETGERDRDGASVPCPRCGAINDPAFSYCRQCASRLRPTG